MSQLVVSSSPHMRDNISTQAIMRDVSLALLPAAIASVVLFGLSAAVLILVCIASCVCFEFAFQKVTGQKITINDLSAVVTGMLLAFCLPPDLPIWMAMIGCFIAIVVVKQFFGGIGCNFANPAIVARIALMLSFTGFMAGDYPLPLGADVVAGPTPLAGGWQGTTMDLLLGKHGGSLGEVCTVALLLGAAYLLVRKVITITTPLAYLGTMAVFSLLLGVDPVFHLLTGGAVLGAFFMATDYVTSPISEKGKLVFGIGCGLITMVIRIFGNYPEGASFAILIFNILAPHIDQLTITKPLGGAKENE